MYQKNDAHLKVVSPEPPSYFFLPSNDRVSAPWISNLGRYWPVLPVVAS